jgi:uncharacterized membrane protein YdjX (TVP38/TMEM64 family)
MEPKIRTYIIFGIGIASCIAGVVYLASEYVKYLSEPGRLGCLLLVVGLFAFLGRHFEQIGW